MPARVLIVYNQPVLPAHDPQAVAERAVFDTVTAVRRHLDRAGFDHERLAVGRDLAASLADIARLRPDAIFNLFEGLGDDPRSEARAARAWESLAVPLTGCPARALRLAGSKHLAKRALAAAGLPTPRAVVVTSLPFEACGLEWPVIAKPALYHASIGIDALSVATDKAQLARRVEMLLSRYVGPVLVEEFIAGREFTAGLIEAPELVTLPAMEFEFDALAALPWPLMTFEAKWCPQTDEYRATPGRHGAAIPRALAAQLGDLAGRAFRRLGCRDYARVDFRVDAQGRPWILEVNPNPDLSPSACLAGALAAAGGDYAAFVVSLARAALARSPRRRLTRAAALH
jgi:D-alanine-D-alanine ligase